jgi:tripartite ATP-independent transporter DctP family solute receptor
MEERRMKKYLSLILVVLLVSVFAFGCSNSKPAESQDANKTEPAQVTEEKAVTLQVGHVEPEDRSTHQALLEFKKEVEEKSNGSITIEIHPNGALGGDVQLTESVAMGTLDMALPATSVLVTYSPEFGILDMPYLFSTTENAFAAMDGEVGAHFDGLLENVGIKNLGYSFNGLRSITNSVRPINEVADLKGLKVRVMESPVFIDFFETLGANATPMSFNELFTGLQQGTVEAQENPPSLIYSNKFYEVQKYLSLTEHVNNFLAFIMNKDLYDSLSADQQTVISEAAKNYVTLQRSMELADTDKYVKLLATEGGLEVNEVSAENKQKLRDALQPMYDKYTSEFGQELFDMTEQYNK